MANAKFVIENLNREVNAIKNRSVGGLMAGGLIIQGESQRRVPVHHGNLRASAYTQREKNTVRVGYQAKYALFVHENLEAKLKGTPRPDGTGVYWGPKGEPRFLVNAAKAKGSEVVAAVKKHSEVKK